MKNGGLKMAVPYTPAQYQLGKIWTNQLQKSDGTKFEAEDFYGGLIKTWGDFDLPDFINQNSLFSVPEFADSEGRIGAFKIQIENRIGVRNRKEVVNQERLGIVEAQPEVRSEIKISLDDELVVGPVFVDNWDSKKLGTRLSQAITQHGSFSIEPIRTRVMRFYENLRVSAKWGNANLTPKDKISRIVEISDSATDIEITKAVQNAIIQIKSIEDVKGYAVGLDGLGSKVVAILTADLITAISNTQALSPYQGDVNQLARGVVGFISGVPIYEALGSEGISYITFRGAVVSPIANAELVENPHSSNRWKGGLEFAAVLVKDNDVEKLMPERVVAIGKGITTKVNQKVRPRPERESLTDVNADIAAVVDWLQSQTLSALPFRKLPSTPDAQVSIRSLGIWPTYGGSDLRDCKISNAKIVKADQTKFTIDVSVEVEKTGGTKKTATWTIYAADYRGEILPTDADTKPPTGSGDSDNFRSTSKFEKIIAELKAENEKLRGEKAAQKQIEEIEEIEEDEQLN